ncbi:MAG: HAMP domain-containing protein [Deltaproteobacteria bacterium]|nr:HAMP domain-containing protein [Deltaproteobacteria bacterium]
MEARLATGTQLIRRILLHTVAYAGLASGVVSLYLWGLLRLTPEQWGHFFTAVGGVFLLVFPAMVLVHRRIFQSIQHCVDRRAAGTATREEIERGFAAVCDFPRYWFAWGLLWWGAGSLAVCLAIRLQDASFGWQPMAVIVCSTLSISFVTDMYYFFTIKPVLAPIRLALAIDLGDPEARRRLIRPVSLRTKLFVAMMSTIVVSILFAGFLALAQAQSSLESYVVQMQENALDAIVQRGLHDEYVGQDEYVGYVRKEEVELEASRRALMQAGASFDLVLLSVDARHVMAGSRELLPPSVTQNIEASLHATGRSSSCDGEGCYSYRRLEREAGLIVAFAPSDRLTTASSISVSFAALLLFSTLVAAGAAFLLARDVGKTTDMLQREASRIAAGDLRVATILDSEDELGELGHAFESMAASLRETVLRVKDAAGRLQSGASEVATASRDVGSATELQIRGTAEADRAMHNIEDRTRGIATAAADLDRDVVDAATSLSQLDSTGGELSRSAGVVSTSIDEVSTSVEEMARAIVQVDESSRDLAKVADDASTSLDHTAAGTMQVNAAAEEMSQLSERVVALSETGRSRVNETIEGMKTIADDTAAAEEAIRGLAESTGEIDSIVEIIDSVASETSLLALNASIIAAQSGEHGRGFAVVADQIGDVARRVTESTQHVRDLVSKLQDQSEASADLIAQGGRSVAQGLTLSQDAGASLDDIAATSQESVPRIEAIVSAVKEQTRAVDTVTELMSRLRDGTSQISQAIQEQSHSTEFVREAAGDIGEASKQLSRAALEQATGTSSIRQSAERIREAAKAIHGALQDQTTACCQVASFLGELDGSTTSNEQSVVRLNDAAESQQRMADRLQEEMANFTL